MSWASRRWGRKWDPAGAQRPLGPRRRPAGRERLHGSRLVDNVCGGQPSKRPAADQTVRVRLMKSEEADDTGGARRDRTADLLHAMQALSQLSYGPTREAAARYAADCTLSSVAGRRLCQHSVQTRERALAPE
jgi:hypothetical protein